MSKTKKTTEELEKIEKGQEKIIKDNELLAQAKQDLIDKANKDLPSYLETRLQEFSDELKEVIDNRFIADNENIGYSSLEIMNLIKQPKYYLGQPPKYSSEEMYLVFEAYQKLISEANKYTKFIPSKESFCRFAGFTTSTFKAYEQSDDPTRREVMQAITDYFVDTNLTLSQKGELKEITTIFRGKTTLGLIEQVAPQVIIHTDNINIDEARKKLWNITQGKNASINLNKQDYRVVEE
jgi:hypothetical protein